MELTHSDIARSGARAANAKRTPAEKTKIGRSGAKALWKGHKKNKPDTCSCLMCKKRRAKKK